MSLGSTIVLSLLLFVGIGWLVLGSGAKRRGHARGEGHGGDSGSALDGSDAQACGGGSDGGCGDGGGGGD